MMSPSLAVMLTAHTLTILGIHIAHWPTHRTRRPPTAKFCSSAGGCFVGPTMATSNMLCNIETDATLTSLCGPPTQTTHSTHTEMRGGVCSSKRCKPLTRHGKNFTKNWCILYMLTAMKTRIIHELVFYMRDFTVNLSITH